MGRFDALIDRWGLSATMALGAMVLFVGIGSAGLWEPWEMDRADLARTLAEPPQVVAAVAGVAEEGGGSAADLVEAAASYAGVALRLEAGEGRRPGEARRPGPDGERALRAALDTARTQVVAAVILDMRLVLPEPNETSSWRSAAQRVNEALGYVPGGRVVLVEGGRGLTQEELETRISIERMRLLWEHLLGDTGESPVWEGVGSAIERIAATSAARSGVVFLLEPSVADLSGLLSESVRGHASLVRFKDRGHTVTKAPLETWLRTAAFRIFGPSEASARIPGALLAFLALWVLMLTARTVWSARVAVISGLVLITTPLFYVQARSVAGDPTAIFALTLVASGLLLRGREGVSPRIVWTYLLAGFATGFLAGGLFVAAVYLALAALVPVVSAARAPAAWRPPVVFGALLALLAVWVMGSSGDGFASQFRFGQPLFSDGPTDYLRNFDLIIHYLGFGLTPWSPLVAVAVGGTIFWAISKQQGAALIVGAWFLLPVLGAMVGLKGWNQLSVAVAPAAALAVALLLEQVVRAGVKSHFVALALLFMFYILQRELAEHPEALVSFLTFDPPFSDSGQLRFPESVGFPSVLRGVLLLAALLLVVHFARLPTFAHKALAFFRGALAPPRAADEASPDQSGGGLALVRRDRPFAIALGSILVLPPVYWLFMVGEAHRQAALPANLVALGEGQRAFLRDFVSLYEPAVLIASLTVAALVIAIALAYVFPRAGRAIAALPLVPRVPPRLCYGLGAAVWGGLAVALLIHTRLPADYAGELIALSSLVGYVAALALGWMVWRVSRDRLQVVAVVVGILSLLLATRLVRDAGWREAWVVAALTVGWCLMALGALSQLLARVERFALGAGVIVSLCLLAIVVPLLDRWTWIEDVLYPGTAGALVKRLVLFSVGTWICYLAIATLILNRYLHGRLAPIARSFLRVEGGPLVAGGVLAIALVFTAGNVFGFHQGLARHVSQKHMMDTWVEAVGADVAAERLFKHGAFAAQGRRDANFYTAGIPEIRDRQAALRVLHAAEDQVVTLETSHGSEVRVFPGWSTRNDLDGDGRRDRAALRGFATDVSGLTLTDATQRWTPSALVGRKLVDVAGRTWDIVDNDEQSVTVAGPGRLTMVPGVSSRAYYAIDSPDSGVHRATAERPERRGLLLPADSLSEINHAFRTISGGPHLPVLDGRSYRVLLAASWLEGGETQQNRIANAVLTAEEFDAITDPRLRRVSGVFDDDIEVVGYHLPTSRASRNSDFRITVYYRALRPIARSYKIFMHLDRQGATERIHGDHWPLNPTRHSAENTGCTGCFRTDHWLPGDIVADTFDVEVGQVGSGDYMIWVGFFLPGPDTRMTVRRFDASRVRHDGQNRLGLGTFQVR